MADIAVFFPVETAVGEARVALDRPAGLIALRASGSSPTRSAPRATRCDAHSLPVALLMVGHGAGGGVDAPDILALREVALAHGVVVARVTQPYRVQGKKVPPATGRLDQAWRDVAEAMTSRPDLTGLPLILAGRSSGARVACRTAEVLHAVGVIALAFPVHPPGKPERSRLDELDSVKVPTLIVQGNRDPFGMPPIEGPSTQQRTLHVVDGADHSLRKAAVEVSTAAASFLSVLGFD